MSEVVRTRVSEGVLQVRRAETRWLSTGPNGGQEVADAAYNISVPEGWSRTDLGSYVQTRIERAGFERRGPALLTGVDLSHARIATAGVATAVATAGLSNPATLCPDPEEPPAPTTHEEAERAGTINVVVFVDRAVPEGAQANLLALVAEAKTAVLLQETGFPGTTTDAVIVGSDSAGEQVRFTGSATPVGAAVRACVRDAVCASVHSRYAQTPLPESSADADHGVVTDVDTEVRPP
jgi:adenosylcobinamide hydrolase